MDTRGMGDPRMDRGMDTRGMDHHRSTSMPGSGPLHGRSRPPARGMPGNRTGPGYHSLDREAYGADREFLPIREPRERSLDRDFGPGSYGAGPYGRRERSLDRRDPMMDPMEDPMYPRDSLGMGARDPMRDPLGPRRTGLSPNPVGPGTLGGMGGMGGMGTMGGVGVGGMGGAAVAGGTTGRDPYFQELHHTNSELQRDLGNLKKELELTNQKLGSSMHSIKTFWSPELKKERALRKEESAKYSLINDQLKLLNSENQVGQAKKTTS